MRTRINHRARPLACSLSKPAYTSHAAASAASANRRTRLLFRRRDGNGCHAVFRVRKQLPRTDVSRAQHSNRICFQQSAAPLCSDFDTTILILPPQFGTISFQFSFRERRSSCHVVSQSLRDTACRPRGSANMGDLTSWIVYHIHA